MLDVIDGFSGPYHGSWKNTTYGTTGTAATDVTVDRATSTVTFKLTLTGSVFGGSAPPPETFAGTFDANGAKFSGTSSTFGPYTITIDKSGALSMNCPAVPGGRVKTLTVTGPVNGDTIQLQYVVSFTAGGSDANGTISLGR